MKEITDRLRVLRDSVRDWDPDGRLASTTLQEIKRRRRRTSVGGGLVVSLLGTATAAAIINLTPNLVPSVTEISPPPASSNLSGVERSAPTRRVSLEGFGAVWPEDTADETSDACSTAASTPGSFRANASGTAKEFGRVVLGWDAAVIARNERAHSAEIELWRDRDVRNDGAGVVVTVVEYVDGCWSVQSVRDVSGRNFRLIVDRAVGQDGISTLSIGFDPDGATSGRVEVGYGPYLETKPWNASVGLDDPVTFRIDPVGRRHGGHVLILLEDDEGRITSAIGAALPAGRLQD